MSPQARADLKLRTQGAATLFSEFNAIQSKLEEAVNEDDLNEQLNQRESFEETYYSTLAKADCMLNVGETVTYSNSSQNESIKLPMISVPTFDGSCERWLEFRDTFLSLVHNNTHISNIQRFHYLKSSLKASAALVIDSLEFSADNYLVAWELILNRYNNNRLLVHNHVKALFTMPALNKESPESLRNIIDNILKNLRALKMLDEPVESWDTLIIYLIVTKLDKNTEREWEQHKNTFYKQSTDNKFKIKVDMLLSFLKDRADMLETLLASHSSTHKYSELKPQRIYNNNQRIHCNVVTNKTHPTPRTNSHSRNLCSLCNAKHPLYACQQFLEKTLDAKLKLINEHNLCINCLRPGHLLRDCRMGPCRKCNLKHNTLVHNDNDVTHSSATHGDWRDAAASISARPPPSPPIETGSRTHTQSNVLCGNYNTCAQPVILSTALVQVADNVGCYHDAFALLDSGSERCIIARSLCNKLKIPLIQSAQQIRGVGNSVTNSTELCNIKLKSRINSYTTSINCFVLSHITCTNISLTPEQHAQFRVPDNISLANPSFHASQPIEILIGADIFWDLLTDGKIRLPSGPYLQNTHLGWLVSGPVFNVTGKGHILCNYTRALDNQPRKFWELEEITSSCDTRSDEERECENHFVNNTIRNSDGRFCVSIPFKTSPHDLGNSYELALKRFLALEKRLSRQTHYKQMYSQFIHEFVDLGHMSPVPTHGTPHYFMPHHGVFREHSVTTKLRVVFDASAPSTSGTSLNNDLQLVGPPIQGDLFAILLRLRQHRFVACADVEKMYRQVLVTESQRDLQLILWRDSPDDPVGTYRINTLVYGTAAPPFLAVTCLRALADACSDPHVKRIVTEDFYVDDLITGGNDESELLGLCEKTSQLLQTGGFPLRKWIFNFNHTQESFNQIDENKYLNLQGENLCKTLGINWNNSNDTFTYNTQFDNVTNKLTKRIILSCVSQIYDPLGLLSPVTMIANVLLQRLWLLKTGWDDELPRDVVTRWWPVARRNLARRIANECIMCRRLKGVTLKPLMGNLPKERITPTLPFAICGVDYAGPIHTLNHKGRGAKTVKSYICLFVCFVTRAVHLELVTDLTSDTYILALKRFISRRGKPSMIYSDNGKNFVGAMNEFAKMLQTHSSDIQQYAHAQSIKFKFIPVSSPHFGGLWESGVKSCKHHLIRVVGQSHLTFEECTTLLVQIEAILNTRPLSPLSSDPLDFLPLIPAHFLVGRPLTAPVHADLRERSTPLLTRFQRIEQLRQHFWSRWAKEYVSELQTRSKWNDNTHTLQPDSLFVIKEDHKPPLKWALGRIVHTYPGRDGISRIADIRTSSGIVRRAFAKICPLFTINPDTLLEEQPSKAGGMLRNGTLPVNR